MGTRTTLFDDLDSNVTDGVETVRFSLDNKQYTIDLGEANRKKLEEALAPFISKATRAGGSSTAPKRGGVPAKEIRAWAKAQKPEIRDLVKSDRGAVPKAVIAAYNEAHGTSY
jgi:hypothetical protein